MPLEEYRRKRDFARTPEPAPAEPGEMPTAATALPRFVVGRHRATRLHYDLRLEIRGVLASWSVPKGPTLDADVRRMAVRVEDHPIEYLEFEGVIPKGQYGAGDAIVWDRGTYEPELAVDPATSVEAGELKLRFHGDKLRGRFTLVQTSGEQWLLIKKRDADAVAGWDAEDHPRSVQSGRTNDEVARAEGSRGGAGQVAVGPAASGAGVRGADAPSGARGAAPAPTDASAADRLTDPGELPGAAIGPMPGFLEPMAASLGTGPFDDPAWLFEIKWDGYRLETRVRAGSVRLWTRRGRDAAPYAPELLGPPDWIAADEAIVDGELVALRPDGIPDFGLLQARVGHAERWSRGRAPGDPGEATAPEADAPLVYEAFDLLYLDGHSLLNVPLVSRKQLLRERLRNHPFVRYGGHVAGDGRSFFRAAAEKGLEGVVAKRAASRYLPGVRTGDWLKLKARPEQEFVVAGFAMGIGSHADLGALILAVHEGGSLRYAGRVGSGMDARTRARLRVALDERAIASPSIAGVPRAELDDRAVRWARPELVARVAFAGWTREGRVRQSSFVGLLPDRDASDVVRELPVALPVDTGLEATDRQPGPGGVRVAPAVPAGGPSTRHARAPATDPPVAPATDPPAGTAALAGAIAASASRAIADVDALGTEGTLLVDGRAQKLTNLDKVLFPAHEPGIDGDERPATTKRDLVRYYLAVAEAILPHLSGRPLNLTRFPNGVERPSFWQRELPAGSPAWLATWREPAPMSSRSAHTYVIADSVATMAWLANQAAIEIHPWTSRVDEPWRPIYALIDIDPGPETTFADVVFLATLYRTALQHLGVRGYPKVTGKRGIQVFVPVEPRYTYEETRGWVEALSRAVGNVAPDLVSWEWAVGRRGGKARLDYTQNVPTKTLVAPYSVRAAAGAPVSAPITWDEVDDPDLRPDRWTIRTLPARLAEHGDLFAGALTDLQVLPSL